MNEFLGASPTLQARLWSGVGAALDVGIQKDGISVQISVPELRATMGGGGPAPRADTRKTEVKAGQGKLDDKKLSADAPKLKPEPTVLPAAPRVDGGVAMKGVTAETPVAQKKSAAKSTIRSLPTGMEGVPRTPGTAPRVPTTGGADTAQAQANRADAEGQARRGGSELRAAVENGRGTDAVQPKAMDEASKIRDLAKPKADASKPVAGIERFMKMGVPADADGAIDANQQAVMDTALSEARGQVDNAVSTKDTDSKAAIDKANTEAESLRGTAESSQQAEVAKARDQISGARESTLSEQEKAVSAMESEAGTRQKQELEAVRARVAQDEAKIDDAYTRAEADIDKKVADGERQADAKKRKAEEDAEDESWWDRVKSAVASAFKALTDAINAVISAVRDAVKAILDGVKQLASAIVDLAAKWITATLKVFGDWLKAAVTLLLGSVFPELAKKLNALIDSAVNYVCEQVNQLAATLKAGIAKLCDWVAAGLDAILSLYQAAMNFALALAEAALTGNWQKVGSLVLEGILKLAGIPPEEFYALVGKADDVINTIADDPGSFLGHCLDAVGQGFGQFSDNFGTHLQGGFLGWMTGAVGDTGLTMPAEFDLPGVFDLTTQVLGLDKDSLRQKAVDRVGVANVERVEFVGGFIDSAMKGGMAGLWEHIKDSLGSLKDEVMGAIQAFLAEKIIKAAVLKIATMFNPVGAIVQAVLTAWNLYEFLRDQITRISGVVKSVVASVADIASGNIGAAANMIEGALGTLVPVAIDLLAKLLGVSGIGAKVKKVIGGLKARVDAALDKLIDKVVGLFSGKKPGKEGTAGAGAGAAGPADVDKKAADEKKNGGVPEGTFKVGVAVVPADGRPEAGKNAAGGVPSGDVKENLPEAVGLPAVTAGGPGATTGQGNGSGKVENGAGVSVGQEGSSNEKGAVSKYAAGDPPAGWQGNVVETRAAHNEPGHTDSFLTDGTVVRKSKPKLLKADVADAAIRSAGLSRGQLLGRKKKSPEQEIRDSGEMTSEELDAMKGALKKDPRTQEALQPDGSTKAVAKPDIVGAGGRKRSNNENSDGTTRAPMTEPEKEALLKGHAILGKDNKQGADMRKVIPNRGVGGMLAGQAGTGAEKLGPSVRGSVGLARNTEGMNAESTVAALGLDYEHNPSTDAKPAAGKSKKGSWGNYTEMSATGKVTMSDEVEKNGLHYIDFKMTKEMEAHAGVAMSQDLIDKAKASKDAGVAAIGNKAHGQEKARRDDPFAATGATSSNALVQKGGANAGRAFDPVLNQELNLNPQRKSAGPGEAGFELEAGAQMKKRGNRAGEDQVIATLVEKADKDGKIVKEWELDSGLEKSERGHYKNKMDHAKSDAKATMRGAGESDADHDKRLGARTAKIAAQQAKDESEATANGNPFDPGSAEFKSFNRKARAKAKTKSDSAAVKPAAPNGDTSAAAPKSAVSAPPAPSKAPEVAAAATEAKAKVVKGSSKSTPDPVAASDAAIESAKKNDAKNPAEAVENLLSPAAKVKPPKQSTPPKDFPEPANDVVQGTTGPTTTPTTPTTKKAAANPGLRKEHEGTGVEYAEMAGERFSKGEGDAEDVDPNDVKQGSLGDCYLLGGMAAVSRANPEHIRKLIKDNGDGTFDVTLYIKNSSWDSKGAAKVVTVDSKFPSADKGLSAKYAKAGDKGAKGPELWCMLIEKAWAVHKGTYTGIEGGHVNDDGKFSGAIALLTNLNEGYYTPSSIADAKLAQMISDALAKKMPVACDSKNLDKEAPDLKAAADKAGVVGNHAYAPKSVDLAGLTIELQNPWGSSHVAGLKIADFKRFYRGLRIGS